MKKNRHKKKKSSDYFITFMFISILVPFIAGIIMIMIDDYRGVLDSNNRGIYMILSSFAIMYIDFCVIVLHKVFTYSKKAFAVTIVISLALISCGLFFTLKGNDEKSEECTILKVEESTILVKFQDIELNIKKPILKKVTIGNNIKVYYNGNNIDDVHFIDYSRVGSVCLIIGFMFLLFGGIFLILYSSYKNTKKIRKDRL